jgi:solute carrier family 30 (zinc transporter), member 2
MIQDFNLSEGLSPIANSMSQETSEEAVSPCAQNHKAIHFDEHDEECQFYPNIKAASSTAKYKLICVCFLSLTFMVIEATGGFISGSIAIMSDAAHLLSDIFGFMCSIVSLHLSSKQATFKMSFGFHRAEIMGAMMSIITIWILTVILVGFAGYRLAHPDNLSGWEMLIIGTCGMIINVSIGLVLHFPGRGSKSVHVKIEDEKGEDIEQSLKEKTKEKAVKPMKSKNLSEVDDQENANVRAALIHILGDLVQSMGIVVVAGVVTICQHWDLGDVQFLDPCCTFMFAIIVACTSIPMFLEFLHIIMEGTPSGIDMEEFLEALQAIPEVSDVHDLHVWSLSVGKPSMTCHIMAEHPFRALRKATRICRRHGIYHSTIQVERTKEIKSSDYVNCDHNLH